MLDKITENSGLSAVVMNNYNQLNKTEINFDFMLNEEPSLKLREYLERNGSKIFLMPSLKMKNFAKYILALHNFYGTQNYPIVHGHVAITALFYLGLSPKGTIRVIHSQNAGGPVNKIKRFRNKILTSLINYVSDARLACSKEAAVFLFGKNNDATIMANPINPKSFEFNARLRQQVRSKYKISDDIKVIGHIGRFCREKNHIFILDVFDKYCKIDANAILMLVGDGELFMQIKTEVQKRGISDKIVFTGKVESINGYLSAMDVFVMPSFSEGLPLAAIEAQTNGLPIILSKAIPKETDVAGCAKFIALDVQQWVNTIMAVQVLDRCNRKCKVEGSKFDAKLQTDMLVNYYKNLLGIHKNEM